MVERGDVAIAFDQVAAFENGFHHADTFLIHWSTATARNDQRADQQEGPLRIGPGKAQAQA